MPSTETSSPPAVWTPPRKAENLTLKIRTITPMFGGGFEACSPDLVNPVRSAAVRGHLRFWWRATQGVRYATSQALYAAEEAIWGSAQNRGAVSTAVVVLTPGIPRPCATSSPRGFSDPVRGWPKYALHPFLGKSNGRTVEEQPSNALLGVEFSLTLAYPPDLRRDVHAAVDAWVRYGGLGARTRRGCGSLQLVEGKVDKAAPLPKAASLCTALCGSTMVLGRSSMDPCEAWREAVDIYQKFRQGVGFARDGGKNGNTPGRSRWPEPDAIRRRTRRHSRYHVPKHEVQDGFPRADLGLPIIFHFKDERDGDPGDFNVSGPETGRTRFASPVITKALACEDGRYRAMVLVLNAPHVWELGDLSVTTGRPVGRAQIELTPEERRNVAPLEGLTVREALTSFVAKEWKAEPEVIA